MNEVYAFNDADPCVNLLTDMDAQEVYLLASHVRGQQLLPYIHAVPHWKSVYMISNNQEPLQMWAMIWSKIRGVYVSVSSTYEDLRKAIQH